MYSIYNLVVNCRCVRIPLMARCTGYNIMW